MKNSFLQDGPVGLISFLRLLIGWHFFYEGIVKWYSPDWSAFGYLRTAQGPFASLFQSLAEQPLLAGVDLANKTALVVVGLSLILGVWERIGALIGAGLLLFYYLAHPPFPGLEQWNVEGTYYLVNKNLIEGVVCLLLYTLPTGQYFGLPALRQKKTLKSKDDELVKT